MLSFRSRCPPTEIYRRARKEVLEPSIHEVTMRTKFSVFLALAAFNGIAVFAQTKIDLRTQGKSVDFSSATSTKPSKTGTAFPATCSTGETFFKTDAPAGSNLYGCTATNIWIVQTGSGGLPVVGGNTNKVLSNNGTTADWRALTGDIS